MAQGLGFIEFTTGDVLSAAAANGYLASQTVMVFADSAARTSAITTPYEGMISYLKDTNSTEYYSGSAWVAIGGASGGMTLLSTTTLSGSSTTVSGISGSYNNLFVLVTGMTNATANGSFRVAINGSTTASASNGYFYASAAGGAFVLYNDYTSRYAGNNSGLLRTDANNAYMLTIFDYASSTAPKTYQNILAGLDGNSSNYIQQGQGGYYSNTAVTSLVFSNAGGNWSTGTVRVYGVK
jgi:hypothetical protein